MEIRGQEGEMAIPLNSSYGGGGGGGGLHPHHAHVHAHMIHHDHHHHHHHPDAAVAPPSTATGTLIPSEDHTPVSAPVQASFKKMVRYRECLKNHAAAMGANATDGCGEFMPSGDDGTLEALTCSACGCHRNFHRKEIDGEPPSSCDTCTTFHHPRMGRKLFMAAGGGHHYHHPAATLMPPSRAVAPHHPMIMSYNMGGGGGSLPSESDDQDDANGGGGAMRPPQMAKKRFRTKFTQEQKEKMLNFAEKVGWKIQKQEESVVQQFCQEVGVKRRVLKVWMHNNKHNLGKKMNLQPNPENQQDQN